MNSIYLYFNYLEYLQDFYKYKKTKDSKYSYQIFADESGIKSKGYVKQVFDGRKRPSLKTLLKLCKGLKLRSRESEYFELLLKYSILKTHEEKKEIYEQIISCSGRRKYFPLEKEHYLFFSSSYHMIIYLMLALDTCPKKIHESYEWIKDHIDVELQLDDVKRVIKDFVKMKLVDINDGEFIVTEELLQFSKIGERTFTQNEFIRQMIASAKPYIEDKVSICDLSSITIPINKEDIPKAKDFISEFRRKIMDKYNNESGEDRIYQFNYQIFPRTNIGLKEKE